MISEKMILAAVAASRINYDRTVAIFSKDTLSSQGALIYNEISDYYERDADAGSCNLEVIQASLARKHPKHSDFFISLLKEIATIPPSINIINELIEFKRNVAGTHLAGGLLNPSANKEHIDSLLDAYTSIGEFKGENIQEEVVEKPVGDLCKVFSQEGLYHLYPSSLNENVGGGVPLHTHIGLMSRPEAGKSLFCINLSCMFALSKRKVLYVGNEDPTDAYIMRMVCRITGMTKEEVLQSPSRATGLLATRGYANIIFDGATPCTFARIENLIVKHKPTLVILDQLRQIYMPGVDGETEQLTKAAKTARRLCKQYPIIVVSVTQAGASAENKLCLDLTDTYMSNTAFAGDLDILIGWGANEAFNLSGRRMITLIKNKINGNHSSFPVLVNPSISKVQSL